MAHAAGKIKELSSASIDPDEIEKFTAMADEWWDPNGKFKPLHKFNPLRLTFLKEQLCARLDRDVDADRPLEGLRLLDIGCGGGLLSEPMARLGAQVTGVDAAEKNVKTAKAHADQPPRRTDARGSWPRSS